MFSEKKLVLLATLVAFTVSLSSVNAVAADGTLFRAFDVPQNLHVHDVLYWPNGITFDGRNLWYSVPSATKPGLFQTSTAGVFIQSLNVVFPTGDGSVAWDGSHLWVASFGGTGTNATAKPTIFEVSVAGGGRILKTLDLSSIFAPDKECGIIDGLSYDSSTGSLWVSPDEGCLLGIVSNVCAVGFAYNVDTSGNLIQRIQYPFSVSGVAKAGKYLYVADRCALLIDKTSTNGRVISSFPIQQVDPHSWPEGLSFDPATFAPNCVIWVMQDYPPPTSFAFLPADIAAYQASC
jgi:hypothetical protein